MKNIRRNLFIFTTAALALLFSLSPAWADSVNVVSGDAYWHAWQTPSTSQVMNAGWGPSKNIVPGTAFWNNWSIDGAPNHQTNIGYWLSGTGGSTALNSTTGPMAFLADSPMTTGSYLGNGATGFHFLKSANTTNVQVTMHVQVSPYSASGVNQFGWFDASNPSVLNPLFGGVIGAPAQTPRGAVATFIPSGEYGFYLTSPSGTYLSTGEGDPARTHFAAFQLPGTGHYMFGIEDMDNAGLTDWDYSDLVIEVQSQSLTNVPEPASLLLLSAGFVGLGAIVRRRRNQAH